MKGRAKEDPGALCPLRMQSLDLMLKEDLDDVTLSLEQVFRTMPSAFQFGVDRYDQKPHRRSLDKARHEGSVAASDDEHQAAEQRREIREIRCYLLAQEANNLRKVDGNAPNPYLVVRSEDQQVCEMPGMCV
jgi:hypothetical protein